MYGTNRFCPANSLSLTRTPAQTIVKAKSVPITDKSVTSDKFINNAGMETIKPVKIVENHGVRNRGWIDENIFGNNPSRLMAIHKRGWPSWKTSRTVAMATIALTAIIPETQGTVSYTHLRAHETP